jgi:ligand-binding SRPBCC domain-containing protein
VIFERTTILNATLEDVFAFFSDPANLGRITPPAMGFRILQSPGRALREGDTIDYSIRVAGFPLKWRTRITMWRPNEAFADLQERGPYRRWLHTHSFRKIDGGVEMHDRVEYELPLGRVGQLFAGWFVKRQLKAIFDYREQIIGSLFKS